MVRQRQAELEIIPRILSSLQENSAVVLHVFPCELPLPESKGAGWDFFLLLPRQQAGTLLLERRIRGR